MWQLLSGPDSPLDSNSPQLRLLHMEQAENMWITTAREVYVGYKDLPPFNKDLLQYVGDGVGGGGGEHLPPETGSDLAL